MVVDSADCAATMANIYLDPGVAHSEYSKDVPPNSFEPGPNHRLLDIAIIGAGIAGLAAAIALCQSGHNVEIYERSRFKHEVGAAINQGPNGSRILRYWGFDFQKAGAETVAEQNWFQANLFELVRHVDFSHLSPRFGSSFCFYHRADLHNSLRNMAEHPDDSCRAAKIFLESEVTDVDCAAGTLTLKGGGLVKKDLIIAADGVHSIITSKVLSMDSPIIVTGQSAFRFVIPTKELLSCETTAPYFTDKPVALNFVTMGDRRVVWYPCRESSLQNFVAIHPDRPRSQTVEGWNTTASMADLLDTYKDAGPIWIEIFKRAKDLKLWQLLTRDPISKWVNDKVVLIGDSAHPMLPHQGQGANQGIEDAAALGALLSNFTNIDQLPRRLQEFQNLRLKRASAIQIFSNAGQDESEKIAAAASPFMGNLPVPKILSQFHDYNFTTNVLRDCLGVLEKLEIEEAMHLN